MTEEQEAMQAADMRDVEAFDMAEKFREDPGLLALVLEYLNGKAVDDDE